MRVAPLQQAIMLDLGARVSAVPRRQISAFPPAYSKLNHWTRRHVRRKIQWHGHVELNMRRAQEFVQVGAEVVDVEHAAIAMGAVVERGNSVFRSAAGHWITDGIVEVCENMEQGGHDDSADWQQSTEGSVSAGQYRQHQMSCHERRDRNQTTSSR